MKNKINPVDQKYESVFQLVKGEVLMHFVSLILVLSSYSKIVINTINISNLLIGYLCVALLFSVIKFIPAIKIYLIKNFEKKINPIRWFEYSLSSTIMVVVIALICGITSTSYLTILILANVLMIFTGYLIEKKADAKSFFSIIGFTLFTGIWLSIAYSLFGNNSFNSSGGEKFLVQSVYSILLVLFLFFGINNTCYVLQIGKWKNYIFVEKSYIVLSILSKSLLVWILWIGIYLINIG